MTTSTTTLTDFLLARIAEDEAQAATRHRLNCASIPSVIRYLGLCDCGIPGRVLAECEAKRRIVEDALDFDKQYRIERTPSREGMRWAAMVAVGQLATAYAEHPDYNPDWRP